MAAPVVQGTQTTIGNATVGSGTFTANYPAGVQQGDLLVMNLVTWNAVTLSTPSGWTLIGAAQQTYHRTYMMWREAPSSPGSSVAVATSSPGTDAILCTVLRITGHRGGTPIDGSGSNPGFATPCNAPSLTPSGPERLSVVAGSYATSVASTATPTATNYTGRSSINSGVLKAAVVSRELASAAATGAVNLSFGVTPINYLHWHVLVAPSVAVAINPGSIAATTVLPAPAVTLFEQPFVVPTITAGSSVPAARIQPGDHLVQMDEWVAGDGSGLTYRSDEAYRSEEDYRPASDTRGTRIFELAVEPGPVTIAVQAIVGGSEAFTPAGDPGVVTVAVDLLSSTALHELAVSDGASIDLGGFNEFGTPPVAPAQTFDPAVEPGPAFALLPLIASTASAYAPEGIDWGLYVPYLSSTLAMWEPTSTMFVELDAIDTTLVFTPLVGQYILLEEPDEPVWGASGGFSARIDVLDAGGGVIASTATASSGIVLVSGSVSEDATQPVTRECTVRLLLENTDDGGRHPLLPAKPGDPLDPRTGGALAIYAGPIRPSGAPALVKLGVFRIVSAAPTSVASGDSLTIRGLSSEYVIASTPFFDVFNIAAGTPITRAIGAIVTQALPNVRIFTESSAVVAPAFSFGDSDNRNAKVRELAAAVGMTVRFDREDRYRIEVAPDLFDATLRSPRWTFSEGAGAVVRDVGRELDDSKLWNGVIVVGEAKDSSSPPVRAQLWDTNPASPVYYNPNNPGASRLGPRPKKIVSPIVQTVAQAQALCGVLLPSILSWPDRITVRVSANPSIEAGDMARVIRTTMGVNGLYEVQSVTHDLLGGASEAVCVARN